MPYYEKLHDHILLNSRSYIVSDRKPAVLSLASSVLHELLSLKLEPPPLPDIVAKFMPMPNMNIVKIDGKWTVEEGEPLTTLQIYNYQMSFMSKSELYDFMVAGAHLIKGDKEP